MNSYEDLVKKLHAIKKLSYVTTHRPGDTGIGKTLEDLLKIEENNVPSPNAHMIELKSGRKNGSSMITLFTKSPLPKKANSELLKKFGYPSTKGNDRKELHTTVKATSFNTLKGKPCFKIEVKKNRVELISIDKVVHGFWTKEVLQEYFERKLPELLYVKADNRGSGINEEFWFNEAWLLKEFSFKNLIKLIKEGTVVVDIRIGQYPDGRPHDHGTGFRVHPDKLDLCFEHRDRII